MVKSAVSFPCIEGIEHTRFSLNRKKVHIVHIHKLIEKISTSTQCDFIPKNFVLIAGKIYR